MAPWPRRRPRAHHERLYPANTDLVNDLAQVQLGGADEGLDIAAVGRIGVDDVDVELGVVEAGGGGKGEKHHGRMNLSEFWRDEFWSERKGWKDFITKICCNSNFLQRFFIKTRCSTICSGS